MACMYSDNVELTYSYGGHLNRSEKKYYEDVIQISRCCLLPPEKFVSYDELYSQGNLVEFLRSIPFSYEERIPYEKNHPMCNNSNCFLFPNEKIKTVIVGLSFACDLNCVNCWYSGCHFDTARQKDLYFHTLYALKGNNLENLVLTNKGEPFYYLEETLEFLQSLLNSDFKCVKAVTNGNRLGIDSIMKIKSISENQQIKFNFLFSVDSISKEVYEKTRIGGDFFKVLENLDLCVKQFGNENVTVSFTAKKTNYKELPFVKDFFHKNFNISSQISFDSLDPNLITKINEVFGVRIW